MDKTKVTKHEGKKRGKVELGDGEELLSEEELGGVFGVVVEDSEEFEEDNVVTDTFMPLALQ